MEEGGCPEKTKTDGVREAEKKEVSAWGRFEAAAACSIVKPRRL